MKRISPPTSSKPLIIITTSTWPPQTNALPNPCRPDRFSFRPGGKSEIEKITSAMHFSIPGRKSSCPTWIIKAKERSAMSIVSGVNGRRLAMSLCARYGLIAWCLWTMHFGLGVGRWNYRLWGGCMLKGSVVSIFFFAWLSSFPVSSLSLPLPFSFSFSPFVLHFFCPSPPLPIPQ